MPAICRDCLTWFDAPPRGRCPHCRRPRLLAHPELAQLSIAHMDCDAFYATVEKRDNPELADKPLIVGGGHRGVVSTCCYIARIAGVRSAMPMFRALKLCPDAVVVKPRMDAYVAVSRQIRTKMLERTPLVEPLSLDEAFLDLSGTERLYRVPPALTMARLAQEIERELNVTVSIGLSHSKYLAKIASDLDKPRGFSVIGKAETVEFLAPRPVATIWGVGAAMAKKLEADGYRTNADLAAAEPNDLLARYGKMGKRLSELSRGIDIRRVDPSSTPKSISSETTFNEDLTDRERLIGHLWRLSVKCADRAKAKELAGATVNLKVKTGDFRTISRQLRADPATNLSDDIFERGLLMLDQVIEKSPFRLIGIGISNLQAADAELIASPDLFDANRSKKAKTEAAVDSLRKRFGSDAVIRGRALR